MDKLLIVLAAAFLACLVTSLAVQAPARHGADPAVKTAVGGIKETTNGTQTDGEALKRRHERSYRRHHQQLTPVRHRDPAGEGIPVGLAKEPPLCPPPVMGPVTPSLCTVRSCESHHQCGEKACCFNGCVHTCTAPLDKPPAFDWIEDTSKILPIFEENRPHLPKKYNSTAYAEGGGEAVIMPGGCMLSAGQYEELKNFMTTPSIQDCSCSGGEVICSVNVHPST